MSYFKIKGVLPPMITPFKENGDVDYDAHKHNILKWNETKMTGYLVLGSNSETSYLTEKEKLELVKATVKDKGPDKFIMAGTGLESTRETIDLTNKVADLGVDCALLLTPCYYLGKMNDDAMIRHYTTVADHSKIPILIYNVTKFTHLNISPKAIAALKDHENIIGMKDSSGSIPQLVTFKQTLGDAKFNLMVGTASAWYPALDMGIEAAIMALANCCPNECVKVQALYDEGKQREAQALYERVFPVNAAVTGAYGIAGLKYVCDLLGFKGGYVRAPLVNLTEKEKKELDEIVKKAELL